MLQLPAAEDILSSGSGCQFSDDCDVERPGKGKVIISWICAFVHAVCDRATLNQDIADITVAKGTTMIRF